MEKTFVTNRPNYCHRRFAESIGCRFFHAKHFLPENIPLLSLPINGFLNSRRLPNSDVYFSESIMDYYPVYYRRGGKKIILLAEDTLFKMDSMPKMKSAFITKLFRSADGFIAISELCKRMVRKYVGKPVRVAYPFPHEEFFHVKSDVKSKNVLFVGRNDKTKGFIELVSAIKMLHKEDPEWNLYLIGECSKSVKKEEGIQPMGFVKEMGPFFQKCAFFVQPAYFDACPATVFEAMNAGMITLISGNIGQTDIFRENKLSDLILPDSKPQTIAQKLRHLAEKNNRPLSAKLVKLSRQFREKERVRKFQGEFNALIEEV